jgi:hypothetical protein
VRVTWESGVVASRIAVITAAVVLLIGMVSGATPSFANTERMAGASGTRALGTDAADTTGVPTFVNALEVPTSNDGFMLIMWLLLIAVISTTVTWGLTRWIDPEESDRMDKVHFE